jgi:tRNA pseudouridine(55) synthase
MIKAYKKLGQTPLELINELKSSNHELKDKKMSYAGRLDPMAVGEMMILVGDKENQNRKKYLNYDKTYEANILFGFSTDTGDLLGLIQDYSNVKQLDSIDLKKALKKIKQIKKIKYPDFSSKVVDGKPLFEWKKIGQIDQIEIPERDIKIKKIKLLETSKINSEDLLNYISYSIKEVNGDFRQDEILKNWFNVLDHNKDDFFVAKIKLKVTSGTYIRSLVNEIADFLENKACLLNLKRVKIHKIF